MKNSSVVAIITPLLGTLYLAMILGFVAIYNPSSSLVTILLASHILFMCVGRLIAFYLSALKSGVNLVVYLKTYGDFIASEIPNILQIITFVGFASYLLKETRTRVLICFIVIILIEIYIRAQFSKYAIIISSKDENKPFYKLPYIHLSYLISMLIAATIFFLSELLIK